MSTPTCPVCGLLAHGARACTCARERYGQWVGGHTTPKARERCRRQVEAWLRAAGRWREYPLRCGECGERLVYLEIAAGGERCFRCARGGVAEATG